MCASNTSRNKDSGGRIDGTITPLVAAAHELKSPLVLIRQLVLSLENQGLADSTLEKIRLTSEKALRLTSDLTRSARLDDALFNLEPINPEQVCRDIVAELNPLFKAKHRDIKIYASRKRDPLLLIANRDLLCRIVSNFTENALHYAEDETIVTISITKRKRGSIIRLAVRDYGPALRADIWQSLKSKLGVSSQPLHNRPMSSGLGLYMAGKFARQMNGEIGAIRHKDGATFFVDLQASRQISLL